MSDQTLSERLRDLPSTFAMCDDEYAQPIILEAADLLDHQSARVSELEKLVEAAYREGWSDGYRLGSDHGQTSFGPRTTGSAESDYEYSDARAALSAKADASALTPPPAI